MNDDQMDLLILSAMAASARDARPQDRLDFLRRDAAFAESGKTDGDLTRRARELFATPPTRRERIGAAVEVRAAMLRARQLAGKIAAGGGGQRTRRQLPRFAGRTR